MVLAPHPLTALVQLLRAKRKLGPDNVAGYDVPGKGLVGADNGIFVQGGPPVSPMANYYGTTGDPMMGQSPHLTPATDLQQLLDKPDPDEARKNAEMARFAAGLRSQIDPVKQIQLFLAARKKEQGQKSKQK